MNILQNQCLWLTEASFTNDAWENRMLDPIFEEALEQLTEEGEIDCSQMDLARDLYYYHSACFIYLGCFSEEGDILPQWRSYADDGRGFAIGFNPPGDGVRLFHGPPKRGLCEQVLSEEGHLYDGKSRRTVPASGTELDPHAADPGKHLNDREIRRAIADDATFSSLRYYCKDASFATEKELRALWLPLLLKDEEGHMAAGNRKAYKQIRFRPEASSWYLIRRCPSAAVPYGKSYWGPRTT